MNDLDKLLADYKGAYLSYPQVRRDVEFKLMAALVAEVKALKALANPPVMMSAPSVPMGFSAPAPIVDLEKMAANFSAAAAEAAKVSATKRGPGRPPKVEEAA